jgi:S1-C subfamily serine protease
MTPEQYPRADQNASNPNAAGPGAPTGRLLPPRPPSTRFLRVAILAALLVSCALYLTSKSRWSIRPLAHRVLGTPLWSAGVVHGAGLGVDELNNIDIYKAASKATVYITSTIVKHDFFYQPYNTQALGSGFLINKDGFILTNYHVISGSQRLLVTLSDQSQYKAEKLDIDRSDDLALIKITPKAKLSFLELGDSDHLQVGQKVLAIGNPFGLEGTLTTGVVSSIGRSINAQRAKLEGMIQTDAAINAGNSGGPLLDSAGQVVGINTLIVGNANIGLGFALPINRAKALLSDYQAGRFTERPRLGVSTVYIAGDLADQLGLPREGGLLVQGIARGGSAAGSDLRGPSQVVEVGNSELYIGGDLIMAFDGQPIDHEDSLTRMMSQKRIGDAVELTVYRNKRKVKVTVKLRPSADEEEQ